MTFAHGSDSYTFVASVDPHGKLTAKVDHPVTKVIPTASGGSSGDLGVGVRPAPRAPAQLG